MNALDQIAPLSDERRVEIVAAYDRSLGEDMRLGESGLIALNGVLDLAAEIQRLQAHVQHLTPQAIDWDALSDRVTQAIYTSDRAYAVRAVMAAIREAVDHA